MPTKRGLSEPDAATITHRLQNDFLYYAPRILKLRAQSRDLVPFIPTPSQLVMHRALEDQKEETGMVRAIILKYRRAKASTYIAGRFYQACSQNEGVSVAIMAHLSNSTNALYRMVRRFQEHNPLAPEVGTSNIKELVFSNLDSRYGVYSAETSESGRADEVSLLHLSECAFMPNLEAIMSGIGNCVAEMPGTEIIMESTAKEPFGDFYERTMDCVSGASSYRLVFVPWSIDPTCSTTPPDDFTVETDRIDSAFPSEAELMEMHGLTLGQIAWRRRKMNGPRNIGKFVREFPLTVAEAFSAIENNNLISASDVAKARKANKKASGAIVLGVDPASMGGDRFVIAARQGRKVLWVKKRKKVKFNEGLEWVKAEIDDLQPDRANIDAGGGGNGDAISSALREDPKYARIVRAVNFGSTSQAKMRRPDKPGPKNRRAEMWGRLRDALESEEGLQLPDEESIQADLCSVERKWTDQEGNWMLERKDRMERSPDEGDAIALTYADDYVPSLHPSRSDVKSFYENKTGTPQGQRIPPSGVGWMG